MTSTIDIEAVLADPEATGELVKEALSGKTRTFLDEVLIDFLRGYFKARLRLIEEQPKHKGV